MISEGSSSRNIEWGRLTVTGIGVVLLLLGARRFFLLHHFGLANALYCCLAVIPAALLLLIFDYVFHHARLVVVIPLVLAVVFVISSPAFEVALGLTLAGAMVMPALSEWQRGRRGDTV